MARKTARPIEPCEFCDEDHWDVQEGKDGHSIYCESYPGHNIVFSSYANTATGDAEELTWSFSFDFCPVCGRDVRI